ncbi:MAG: phosphopantetheine-binding protein [Pleurocapsa sp.]
MEAVLNQYPNTQTSVVLAQSDRLVAYVVLNSLSTPSTIKELRQFSTDRLPHYMIPSSYIILEKLPLTPNGKVDRAALAKTDPPVSNSNLGYKEPQSKIERAIAEIWQNVLQIERVGLTDNFFDLGGQSLLMIRVHGLLKNSLGVDISLVDMFRYPTVASLAEHFKLVSMGDGSNYDLKMDIAIDKDRVNAGKDRLMQRRKKRQI